MSLTIKNIRDRSIYLEATDTLAQRIDFVWLVYTNPPKKEDRKEALEFLIYAFDISNTKNINKQLIQLMAKRAKYKESNPDYIPGKSPQRLPFDPKIIVPKKTGYYGQSSEAEVTKAIESKEILDVPDEIKKVDIIARVKNLNPKERGDLRVHIYNGVFIKDGKIFDSSAMKSHFKPGYAAFTLNSNGELTLFTHQKLSDSIAHSSMNAGAPVVAAGELEIEAGVLKTITTYSGHYKPSLFNVYRVLEHFTDNGVSIILTKRKCSLKPTLLLN